MRAIVQRVNSASVTVDNSIVSEIKKGLLVFVGFNKSDENKDFDYIYNKLIKLRIFEDEFNKMNLSVLDKNYEILIVSQFTLYGDCRKGTRPSFDQSAPSNIAIDMYNDFLNIFKLNNIKVKTGIFKADMKINLENDGPVTIQLDSNKIY